MKSINIHKWLSLGFFFCLIQGVSTLAFGKAIWKRSGILEASLIQALELPKDNLCIELGEYSCFDYVHQYSLGGHNAEDLGQFKGQREPSIITAVTFERVILNSCQSRLDADIKLSEQEDRVFKFFPLQVSVAALEKSHIHSQITDLYRRLFQRNPSQEEVEVLIDMAISPQFAEQSSADLARMLCFVIGSQTSFLFY